MKAKADTRELYTTTRGTAIKSRRNKKPVQKEAVETAAQEVAKAEPAEQPVEKAGKACGSSA